jgi:hypothetical protein
MILIDTIKKNVLKLLSFLLLLSFFGANGQQQYPVKVNAYSSLSSNLISDYGKGINFRVIVSQTDPLAEPIDALVTLKLKNKNAPIAWSKLPIVRLRIKNLNYRLKSSNTNP